MQSEMFDIVFNSIPACYQSLFTFSCCCEYFCDSFASMAHKIGALCLFSPLVHFSKHVCICAGSSVEALRTSFLTMSVFIFILSVRSLLDLEKLVNMLQKLQK